VGCFVGRGAWQDWSYEVQVVNDETNTTLTLSPERGTSATVNGLLPGCVYHIRVRAASTEGSGPWSNNFTAQTLSTGRVSSTKQLMILLWLLGSLVSGLTQKVIDEFSRIFSKDKKQLIRF